MDAAYLRNHIALTSSYDINEICKPLKSIHVDVFCYHRIFSDDSEILLTNNVSLTELFYKQNYTVERDLKNFLTANKLRYFIWPYTDKILTLNQARDVADMFYGVSIILDKNEDDSYDFFGFGVSKKSSFRFNMILNYIDLLIRFAVYFKYQAASIIEQCKRNKMNPKKLLLPDDASRDLTSSSKEILEKKFINETRLDSFLYKKLDLSARELDCIDYLLSGKTAREIADLLYISSRTVETHLVNIKQKLNCRTKSELISHLIKIGFRLKN